jgi:Protein of unknown function (DUF4199)
MGRVIGVYGAISGIIVAVGMLVSIMLVPHGGSTGMVIGYLNMLIALSMVFVGVKRYRDTVNGGVIRFWPALSVGAGIVVIAALFYVAAWEVYMYSTNYTFMDEYVRSSLESMKAAAKPASEIAKFERDMAEFKAQYANPLYRMLITFAEIAPVGLLVALISAALLRNYRFMPARVQPETVSNT